MTHLEGERLAREVKAAIVATSRRYAADHHSPACGSIHGSAGLRALLRNRSPTCASPKGRGS
jgi:hypothetical protein